MSCTDTDTDTDTDFSSEPSDDGKKIGLIHVDKDSKFWIYCVNSRQWPILKKHLATSEEQYLPTFRYERVMPDDIIIVFSRGLGFTCAMTVEEKLDPYHNAPNCVKIFSDAAIGRYNTKLASIDFFIKPIKIEDIFHYFGPKPKYKTKTTFSRKYCNSEFVFKILEDELGRSLLDGVESVSRIDKDEWLTKQKEEEDKEEEQEEIKETKKKKFRKTCFKAIRKGNTNCYSTHSCQSKGLDSACEDLTCSESSENSNQSGSTRSSVLSEEYDIVSRGDDDSSEDSSEKDNENRKCIGIEEDNENNEEKVTPMVPILFDPCDEFRWYEECKDDADFIQEFKAHYCRCGECEENNNNARSLGPYLDNSEIVIDMACMDDPGFREVLDAYMTGAEKITEEDTKNNIVQLNIIQEPNHYYDDTILVEWGIKCSKFIKAEIEDE